MKKSFLKRLKFLTMSLLALTACENGIEPLDSEQQNVEHTNPTVYHERITADEVPALQNLIVNKIGSKKTKLSLKTNNLEDLGEYEVNWDEVNVITDTLGIKNFAFRLETENPDPLVFYNIVVTQDDEGDFLNPILAEYVLDYNFYLEWLDDPEKLGEFRGEVYYYGMDDTNFSKSSNAYSLTASGGDGAPCPSVTFGPSGPSAPYIPNIYCWTYVSYGLCETQINYNTGSNFHGSGSCGAGTGSPIYGYGVTCGGTPNPPNINVTKGVVTGKTPCGGGGATLPGGIPINPVSPGAADIGSFVGYLDNKLQLTTAQEDFLEFGQEVELILEIQLLLEIEDFSDEAKIASRMTIEAERLGLIDGPYNSTFGNAMNPYLSENLTDPGTLTSYLVHFSMRCVILKEEHDDWPDRRIYWEASREMAQLILDIGGLVPVVGEVCDIANGVIYTIYGDGVNATLSFSAAIPFAGWFATGAKLAKKGINLADGSKTTLKWVVIANDVINFGDRSQLAKVIGTRGTSAHAHHIIPWAFRELPIVQKAAKSKNAFHMNEALNGIPLPSSNHLTGHSSYNTKVNAVLNQLDSSVGNNNELAYSQLSDFITYLDNLIENNPTKNLGEIASLINY